MLGRLACDDTHMTTDLSAKMDFDHVIEVHADGTVTDAPSGIYAPEMYDDDVSGDWTLLDGYSGQHGYSGPTMHASEQIGGRLARDILDTPGYYVAIMSYVTSCGDDFCDDDCDHVTGWAIASRPSPETAAHAARLVEQMGV